MHNGPPFFATLQQPVPACDGMTDEEFNMMMATGYKRGRAKPVANGQSVPLPQKNKFGRAKPVANVQKHAFATGN